jgi:hypothetical protein
MVRLWFAVVERILVSVRGIRLTDVDDRWPVAIRRWWGVAGYAYSVV